MIELLIVIAIIAILAAMLMPALRRAREQAMRASCSGNLNQVGLMLTEYDHDNGGRIPNIRMDGIGTSGDVFIGYGGPNDPDDVMDADLDNPYWTDRYESSSLEGLDFSPEEVEFAENEGIYYDLGMDRDQPRYLDTRQILRCPSNPPGQMEDADPKEEGDLSYYADPATHTQRNPMRAIAADRNYRETGADLDWQDNHGQDGVNVLFEDRHVTFVRDDTVGASGVIANPYLDEDTDIYDDTAGDAVRDHYRHAWIRWVSYFEGDTYEVNGDNYVAIRDTNTRPPGEDWELE